MNISRRLDRLSFWLIHICVYALLLGVTGLAVAWRLYRDIPDVELILDPPPVVSASLFALELSVSCFCMAFAVGILMAIWWALRRLYLMRRP